MRPGGVLDARSWCVARAGGDVAAGLAYFAAQQGAYLPRREGFEDLWEHGRRFVYGAVNAGGMGTEGRFGPFCIVIADPEAQSPKALAVFPGDSAQRYTTADGGVDAAAAEAEATAWRERAALAVVHHSSEATGADPGRWGEVVCRRDHYLEVVVAGHLPVSIVDEVRLRGTLVDRLDELESRRFLGEALAADEDNEVRAYRALQRWRQASGTTIAAVA